MSLENVCLVLILDVDYIPSHKIPRLRLLEFLSDLQFEPKSPFDVIYGSLRGEILKAKAANRVDVLFCSSSDIVDDYGKPLTWRAVAIYDIETDNLEKVLEVIDKVIFELMHTSRYKVARYKVSKLVEIKRRQAF